MTFYWIYDIPNWALGVLCVTVFGFFSLLGLFATRPAVRRILGSSSQHNDIVSFFFAGIGVFYGLMLGLIAVGTWQNFSDIDSLVSKESAALAALYRDLDAYDPPLRAKLEDQLRAYTRFIIEKEWPAHRRGEAPEEGTYLLDKLENELMAFNPVQEREKINQAEVLRSLNTVVELRRLRLLSVGTGLPASLWCVVMIGAWLNITLTYLFWVENLTLHATLIAILSTFIALMIFLTAAMDNPFRGEFSITPDAFQEILNNLMKPGTP